MVHVGIVLAIRASVSARSILFPMDTVWYGSNMVVHRATDQALDLRRSLQSETGDRRRSTQYLRSKHVHECGE